MLDNYIGRIVAFVLTPILLPLMGVLAFWLQDVVGVDMDPEVATGFVVSVVVGLALAVWQWLKNRGDWETQAEKVLTGLNLEMPGDIASHPDYDPETQQEDFPWNVEDIDVDDVPLDDLPDDETEFASPPPDPDGGDFGSRPPQVKFNIGPSPAPAALRRIEAALRTIRPIR